MADEVITNGILLGHIQAIHGEMLTMKSDLQQQIDRLDQKMDQRFEEARQHRQALQEDLDATIRMVGKHEVKLSRR